MVGSAAVEAAGRRARAGGPEEDRRYSWLEDYLATLEGKEAREEYYARLEYELEWLRGRPLVPPDDTAPVKKRSAG
jgi:hypothetical protein